MASTASRMRDRSCKYKAGAPVFTGAPALLSLQLRISAVMAVCAYPREFPPISPPFSLPKCCSQQLNSAADQHPSISHKAVAPDYCRSRSLYSDVLPDRDTAEYRPNHLSQYGFGSRPFRNQLGTPCFTLPNNAANTSKLSWRRQPAIPGRLIWQMKQGNRFGIRRPTTRRALPEQASLA